MLRTEFHKKRLNLKYDTSIQVQTAVLRAHNNQLGTGETGKGISLNNAI